MNNQSKSPVDHCFPRSVFLQGRYRHPMRYLAITAFLLFSISAFSDECTDSPFRAGECEIINGEFVYLFISPNYFIRYGNNELVEIQDFDSVPKNIKNEYQSKNSLSTHIKGSFEFCPLRLTPQWRQPGCIKSAKIESVYLGEIDCNWGSGSDEDKCNGYKLNEAKSSHASALQAALSNLRGEQSKQKLNLSEIAWNDWLQKQCSFEAEPYINHSAMAGYQSCFIKRTKERISYLQSIRPCEDNGCP